MSSDLKRKVKDLQEQVIANGFRIRTNGRHPVAVGGAVLVPIPVSPSDHRGVLNLESQLRRAGYLTPTAEAQERQLRRASTKNVAPIPVEARKRLNELIKAVGRKPLVDMFPELYLARGLRPVDKTSYYGTITRGLNGEGIGEDGQAVLMDLLARFPQEPSNYHTYQGAKNGQGLLTVWRCRECDQEFESKTAMAGHEFIAHPVMVRPSDDELVGVVASLPEAPYEDAPEVDAPFAGLSGQLHLQILAAILDPATTREEAFALAERVRGLEVAS
jgi:hypothetical protein